MGRVVWDPDWVAKAEFEIELWMDNDLGVDIETDAKLYCPKDTGALAESIKHYMENPQTLVVEAGPWEPGLHGHPGVHPYAAYVELGHTNYRDAQGRFVEANSPNVYSGPEFYPPNPFLRKALYTERRP
jgi:hypothetical protein